jgi:hypothetical protein
MGLDLESLGLRRDLLREGFVLGRVMRGMEATDDAEIAVDLLARDELRDPFQRVLPFLDDAEGGLRAVPFGEILVAWLDAGRDLPAIARAAAEAGVLRVEH